MFDHGDHSFRGGSVQIVQSQAGGNLRIASMNVHFLCKRYYTNKDLLGDRFGRLFHLPIQLAACGASVAVTAIDYRNSSVEEISADGVAFRTAPATPTCLPRLIVHLYGAVRAAQPDVVIASGDSHIGFVGRYLARRIGARFVYDVYDYYPAFPTNRIPGMKALFRSATRNANLVLCASEPLRQTLAALNRQALLVQNGVDRRLFKPMDLRQARDSIGLPQQIPLVGYFGSITPSRGPLIIEACRRLRQAFPLLRLVLAGRITDAAIGEPWITYYGALPQESIPQLIAACNVVTLPYARDTFNSMSGACKIAEYLACARPVVATRVAGHELIFANVPNSLCEPDADEMAAALQRQLDRPAVAPFPETMDWKHIGRDLFLSLCTVAQGASVYED
jgi:glycosyltransferase involved in cell wall biosynthesis